MNDLNIKPIVGTQPDLSHPQSRGVVSDWLFNEGNGSQVLDSFPSRNHGKIIGAIWVPGRDGYALSFNGSAYVNMLNPASLQIRGQLEIAVWFKTTVSGTLFLVAKDDGINRNYVMWKTVLNRINFRVNVGGVARTAASAATNYDDGIWHYVVGSYDKTRVRINVDGVVTDGDAETGDIDNDPVDLHIGQRTDGLSPWQGLISDVSICNKASSIEEIAQRRFNSYAMFERPISPGIFVPELGKLSRYHDLSGLSGQGQMTWNPLG